MKISGRPNGMCHSESAFFSYFLLCLHCTSVHFATIIENRVLPVLSEANGMLFQSGEVINACNCNCNNKILFC
jgi:hypothetical protein